MYGILSNKNNIIAVTDDKKVILEYYNKLIKHHPESSYSIIKIKKKKKEKIENIDELYLVKYKNSYVPNGYLDTISLFSSMNNDFIYEYNNTIEVLSRIIINENENLDKDEIKNLKKSIKILNKLIDLNESDDYTYSEKELKEYENEYECMKNLNEFEYT